MRRNYHPIGYGGSDEDRSSTRTVARRSSAYSLGCSALGTTDPMVTTITSATIATSIRRGSIQLGVLARAILTERAPISPSLPLSALPSLHVVNCRPPLPISPSYQHSGSMVRKPHQLQLFGSKGLQNPYMPPSAPSIWMSSYGSNLSTT